MTRYAYQSAQKNLETTINDLASTCDQLLTRPYRALRHEYRAVKRSASACGRQNRRSGRKFPNFHSQTGPHSRRARRAIGGDY